MAKLEAYGKAFRDSLKGVNVKMVGLVAGAGTLVATVAATETFNFTILQDLADSALALLPTASELLDAGAPLVIKFCIVAAVCAPFIWIYHKAY
jgi:acetylornithine/succinyldiaminopimelate/putrescine aminotransferase